MAITGKQVRQLRSMANNLKPCVMIGKEGVTESVLKQIDEDLEAVSYTHLRAHETRV